LIKCNILSNTFLKHENGCDVVTLKKCAHKWILKIKYISECWRIWILLSSKCDFCSLPSWKTWKFNDYVTTCLDWLNTIFVYKFCNPASLSGFVTISESFFSSGKIQCLSATFLHEKLLQYTIVHTKLFS
jgi:hypothetical protein